MANRKGKSGNNDRFLFLGLQNYSRWWLWPQNDKMLAPWKKSYDRPRQHIKKQRHHLADKGPSSQRYGFLNNSYSSMASCNLINDICCFVTKSSPILVNPWTISHRLFSSWDFQARILEWVAISFSGLFRTQASNLCLLHWQADSLPLSN